MVPWETRVVGGVDLADKAAAPARLDWWMRTPPVGDELHLHQALLAHATDLTVIGTALRPFDGVSQADSTISLHTAVTTHTLWFHQPFRVDDWLQVAQQSPVVANGRAFGRGDVWAGDELVAIVRPGVDGPLDRTGKPMSKRALLVATLPHGPQDPVASTPPRRPESVRRTTVIDQQRGDPGEPMRLVASGRDLLTRADGTSVVLDEVVLRADIDAAGNLTAIEADPPVPALQELVGGHTSRGFRKRADEVVPEHRDGATVLHQLLDDVPMAALINGYGVSREAGDGWTLPPEAADRLTDLCAGWAGGGTMLDSLASTGIFPLPLGPPAPDLSTDDDELAWHDIAAMVPRSVRRRRRIDLVAGDVYAVDVHFRDSHLGTDDAEDVLHEYTLAGTVDPASLVVLSSEAVARTLPWPECPGAIASAGRIVGEPVDALRSKVHADFTGTSTCTHLNDVLRSLAGVTALAKALA